MPEKKKMTIWNKFVKYQRTQFPDKTLKDILQNYDKSEYAKFKKNPEEYLGK